MAATTISVSRFGQECLLNALECKCTLNSYFQQIGVVGITRITANCYLLFSFSTSMSIAIVSLLAQLAMQLARLPVFSPPAQELWTAGRKRSGLGLAV